MIEPRDIPARLRKSRLNPPEAADYLGEAHGLPIAATTLAKLRSIGGGPVFLKFNRAVLYDRTALDAWAAEKISPPQRTTAHVS